MSGSKRGIKLAMDCSWSKEGRSVKNKDVRVPEVKNKKKMSEL
jgi:hypothetical protein